MGKICTECIPEINYTAEEMREYTKASEIRCLMKKIRDAAREGGYMLKIEAEDMTSEKMKKLDELGYKVVEINPNDFVLDRIGQLAVKRSPYYIISWRE
ncbi:hypothetical protein ACG98G_04970 [Megasphaera hexanoica]|uniref:Uncharacterized protein n=1 Tax=Megasphaera hexanoica TaxID=1675036 RepID=A0ABW7DNZ8_9FIRM|nr:hypothetical protein [Megasphaera hexanoica]AXB82629.1 hypothetical protein ACT01_10510 [Megasphaera hexanoica]